MKRLYVKVPTLGLMTMLVCGCPRFPRPDDSLEPNNSTATATVLEVDIPVTARVVQGNVDVFKFAAGQDEILNFTLESLGEEDCAAFIVTGPNNTELFADQHFFCGNRDFDAPMAVEGAGLNTDTQGRYVLSIPTSIAGDYFLTINELGQVDNIFDFSWLYRLRVTTTALAE